MDHFGTEQTLPAPHWREHGMNPDIDLEMGLPLNVPPFCADPYPDVFQSQVGGGQRRRARSATPHETTERLRTSLTPSKRDDGGLIYRVGARRQLAAASRHDIDIPSSDVPDIRKVVGK
jgi:hypothetical protein